MRAKRNAKGVADKTFYRPLNPYVEITISFQFRR
jgi:hypothetical protein